MSILKIKDQNGQWASVYTIKGDKGEQGIPGINGDNGKSPYYNEEEDKWYEWDDNTQSYIPSPFEGGKGISDPATTETLGAIVVGDNLKITESGVLSVDTSDSMYDNNTKPITSAAVLKEVGNIEVLLQTI